MPAARTSSACVAVRMWPGGEIVREIFRVMSNLLPARVVLVPSPSSSASVATPNYTTRGRLQAHVFVSKTGRSTFACRNFGQQSPSGRLRARNDQKESIIDAGGESDPTPINLPVMSYKTRMRAASRPPCVSPGTLRLPPGQPPHPLTFNFQRPHRSLPSHSLCSTSSCPPSLLPLRSLR